LAPKIRDITAKIAQFVQDEHPLVRHAAVRALAQFGIDFGEDALLNADGTEASAEIASSVLKDSHGAAARARAAATPKFKTIQDTASDIVVPAILLSLGAGNAAIPRIRGLAASALVNFLRGDIGVDLEKSIVDGADSLMVALIGVMKELPADFFVSKGAILAGISTIAGILEDKFQRFYASVTPSLKELVLAYGKSSTPEQITLRNRALECLTIAICSVGKATTGIDAAEALNYVVSSINAGFPDSDTDSFDGFCTSIAMIADCLGADFAPYLPVVIPLIAAKASQEVKGEISDILDESAVPTTTQEGRMQIGTFDVKGEGTRVVSLDSVALNEKTSAISTLTSIVSSLGTCVPAFHQFVDPLLTVALAAAKEKFPSIRRSAVDMISYLLMAAISDRSGDGNHGQRLLDVIFPFLIERVGKEKGNHECTEGAALEICEVAKIAFESADPDFCPMDAPKERGVYRRVVLRIEHMGQLYATMKSAMSEIDQRRHDAASKLKENPDADDEAVEKLQSLLESDDQVLSNYMDTVGYSIKILGAAAMPILMSDITRVQADSTPKMEPGLGPDMLRWLTDKSEFQIPRRTAALCLADDIIEFAGQAAASSAFPAAFPHFIECAASNNSILRHPAVYGLGLCAQFCGPVFDAHVQPTLQLLYGVITHKNAKEDENMSGTESA
jgi:hypothetical protein